MYPLYMWWAWDFKQCARGIYDTSGPFGEALEGSILARSGEKMKFVAAVVDICGDMSAWIEFSGLRTWSHKEHPCGACKCTLPQIQDPSRILSVSSDAGPWVEYSHDDYLEDVRAHKLAP